MMFEPIEKPQKRALPRWLAVMGAMLGMFCLGLVTGKMLMGAKPVIDWFTTIGDLVMITVYTIVCAVYAFKSGAATAAKNSSLGM
jgi:hypothetical protein